MLTSQHQMQLATSSNVPGNRQISLPASGGIANISRAKVRSPRRVKSRSCRGDDESKGNWKRLVEEFSWVPPNLNLEQVRQYFNSLPQDKVPIKDSVGDLYRSRQLIHQLPLHDDQETYYNGLSDGERLELRLFSERRKRENMGRGEVRILPLENPGHLCCGCGAPIKGGDVFVFASKSSPRTFWHPGCFCCCVCHEFLVDLIYCHLNGHIYCGRHHAEKIKPRCSACDRIIFADECTEAEGRHWHMKHFCCFECDQVLGGQRYTTRDGRPHCTNCFERLYADHCCACGKLIGLDDVLIQHENFRWHSNEKCFCCSCCGKSLMGPQRFLPKNGKIYCSRNCSQKDDPTVFEFDSQGGSIQYELAPSPVSHNVRRSQNLENLSLNEKPLEELAQKSLENERFDTSNDIYPVNAILAASSLFSKNFSNNQTSSTSNNATLIPLKTSEPLRTTIKPLSEKILVTSPTSTVSSRSNDVTFSHGQNTFNSTDSSGYSSSTLEVLDQNLKFLSLVGLKSNQSVLPEEISNHMATGEDCPEDSASEFSFRLNPNNPDSTPTRTDGQPTKLFLSNANNKSIFVDKLGVGAPPAPTPAPRSRYSSSLTCTPPVVPQTKQLDDPWLHRSQLSDPEQVFCYGKKDLNFNSQLKSTLSFSADQNDKTERVIQRSQSERGCSSNRSPIPTFNDSLDEASFQPSQTTNSASLENPSTNFKRSDKKLKSILKKNNLQNYNERSKLESGSLDKLNLSLSQEEDFEGNSGFGGADGDFSSFQRNHRVSKSARYPNEYRPAMTPNSLRTRQFLHAKFPRGRGRSHSEIKLDDIVSIVLNRQTRRKNHQSNRNGKVCSKNLKRTHSNDVLFRSKSSGKEDFSLTDVDENDGWCSTCTSSDDSDYERWDKFDRSPVRRTNKARRGSVPLRKPSVSVSGQRPSHPFLGPNPDFSELNFRSSNPSSPTQRHSISYSSHQQNQTKQCVIQ